MHADHEVRRYADQFPFAVHLSRNLQFMAHWHEEIEVVLVLEGQLCMGVNQREFLLEPGDIGVATAQDIHYYGRQGESTLVLLIFQPSLVPLAPGWTARPQDPTAPRTFRDSQAAALIHSIHHEFTARDQDWKPALLGHTAALTSRIGRALFPGPPATAPSVRQQRMRRALDYLNQHFREDLSLETVAAQVALSPWAFSHQFSPTVGMHFRAYLNGLRIREARRLLADPDRKVVDVALECGFTSLRSFNRAFREQTGTTPRRGGTGRGR